MPGPRAQRRMDGLVAAGTAALDGGTAADRHGAAPHISILVRDETLAQAAAQISAIRWHDGLPPGVGRTMRTEPPGLRRALQTRDRGCRWPGCGALATWATAHHITPRRHGGATSPDDLVLSCHVHHHYLIHLLGRQITSTPHSTLHPTHPGRWLTLNNPLPGTDLLAA